MSFGVQGVTNPWQTDGTSSAPNLRSFANLNLSESQRTQLRSIFKNAKSQGLSESDLQSQVNAVLTPDQQKTLQTDLQTAQSQNQSSNQSATQSQTLPPVFSTLNLSQSQQQQIAQILQSAQTQGLSQDQVKSQVNAVLTTAQQQQLQTNVQNAQSAHSGHHHHHGGGGSASSTATVNGLSETDIQNQILAATSINNQQIQSETASS